MYIILIRQLKQTVIRGNTISGLLYNSSIHCPCSTFDCPNIYPAKNSFIVFCLHSLVINVSHSYSLQWAALNAKPQLEQYTWSYLACYTVEYVHLSEKLYDVYEKMDISLSNDTRPPDHLDYTNCKGVQILVGHYIDQLLQATYGY